MPRDRFGSLAAFYRDNRARRRSRKVDFGVRWLDRPAVAGVRPPPWRVTYIRDTRELFATPLTGDGPVLVLGIIPPLPFPASWTAGADRLLSGWTDPELTGWQLGWVRARLAGRAWKP